MLVVPVYNKLIMSYSDIYFSTEEFNKLAGRSANVGEKVVLMVLREKQPRSEWTDNSFYPIGVTGVVSSAGQGGITSVKTMNRVNIDMVGVNANHSIDLTISRRPDIQDLDETESYQKLQALKEETIKVSEGHQWSDWIKEYVKGVDSIGSLAAGLSQWMRLTNEERYAVLAEDSESKRTEMLERMLYEFFEVAKVTEKANEDQQKQYQDAYREQAIKKQMEYLQKELDEMHPENLSDIEKYDQKIKDSGMNETARKEAEKVLSRLKQEGQQSPEHGMLYDWLDFITKLSWKKEPAKHIDLKEARAVLDADHYGLKKVKDRIIQQIAVMNLKKEQKGSILLFVGAPGTGKTSIGKSIAKALGREYVRVSLGGVRDEADIRGHRRTYIGAMPGRIMDGIAKSGVSNPVMVLDEVDKLSLSYNGDPSAALLEVLDPEQNNTFTDHYMNVPYDLSDVLFICTANTVDTIPAPLLNRMEVIRFTGYTPVEKFEIAKRHLLPQAMKASGIPEDALLVEDETIRRIISDYTMEAGVRGLRKRLDTLCRILAVQVSEHENEIHEPDSVTMADNYKNSGEVHISDENSPENTAGKADDAPHWNEKGQFVVTPDMLRDELDMQPVHHDSVLKAPKAGIVTGLAWTEVGGEILYIETLLTKGSGKLILTGKLGDVMKESAQIAVSLVKSIFPDKAELFEKNDLHIHVPEGAVPKDGPSAGITLTTAIASLVSGIPVDPTIAMTGEVSLRGAVTPIGGLPEKLMAAERAGVKHVFIPADNVEDLKDVAKEVKDALTITPVNTVYDVLKATGIIEDSEVIKVG